MFQECSSQFIMWLTMFRLFIFTGTAGFFDEFHDTRQNNLIIKVKCNSKGTLTIQGK